MVGLLLANSVAMAVLAQPGIDADARRSAFAYTCRVVTAGGELQSAAVQVLLPEPSPTLPQERSDQVTVSEAGTAVFPGVNLPQTVAATDRSTAAGEPGYLQFGLTGAEANYLVALHVASGRDLPAYFFVSRDDHREWRRNWYWASGFCVRQTGNVQ